MRISNVGSYLVSAYGLYNIMGNVGRWCLNEHDSDFYFTFPCNSVPRNSPSAANNVEWAMSNFMKIKSPACCAAASGSYDAKLVLRIS